MKTPTFHRLTQRGGIHVTRKEIVAKHVRRISWSSYASSSWRSFQHRRCRPKRRTAMVIRVAERTMLDDEDAYVSTSHIAIGGKTYATANITSVCASQRPPNRMPWIALLIAGVILLLAHVYISGAVLAIVSISVLVLLKRDYVVVLGSASGEMQALKSRDSERVNHLVVAIQRATIQPG